MRIRQLLDQESTTDTQYDQATLDNLIDEGRRLFATILPEEYFPNLIGGEATNLTVSSGIASYPSDMLRKLERKVVKVGQDAAPPLVVAQEIAPGQEWVVKQVIDNDLIDGDTTTKYYREEGRGVAVYPTSDDRCLYPYLKAPSLLESSTPNSELPDDISDLVTTYAYERLMRTERGDDIELATALARDRGFRVRSIYNKIGKRG